MNTTAITERPVPQGARLSKEQRRDHLLDCAAQLLVDGGVAAMTMEGVAALAGVSKALPYAHFENATAMMQSLRERELDRLATRISGNTAQVEGLEAIVRAAVHAYFESIRERGTVLVAVLQNLPMEDEEADQRQNPTFFEEVLQEHLGLSDEAAHVASAVFVTGIDGAVDVWVRGRATQEQAEDLYARLLLGGVLAVAAQERDAAL